MRETIETSLRLPEAVLVGLGVVVGPVIVSIYDKRVEYRAMIKAMVPDAEMRTLSEWLLRNAGVQ